MQNDVVGHDTEVRGLSVLSGGLGALEMDQDVPFHCSMSPWVSPLPLFQLPTATQNEVVGHDTEVRALLTAGLGWLGLDTTDHEVGPADVGGAAIPAVTSTDAPRAKAPTHEKRRRIWSPTPMRRLPGVPPHPRPER